MEVSHCFDTHPNRNTHMAVLYSNKSLNQLQIAAFLFLCPVVMMFHGLGSQLCNNGLDNSPSQRWTCVCVCVLLMPVILLIPWLQ